MKQPAIATTIRAAREASGLTQAEAAEKAGYSRSMWGRFELGQRTPPQRAMPAIMAAISLSPPPMGGVPK
jgi:transcriptional regulator with XRE-family HTH domain